MFGAIFFIAILVILVPLAYGALLVAPWLPTKRDDVDRALAALDLAPHSTVIDLGCGDGRFLIEAAKQGHAGIGYDVAWLPVLKGRWQARKAGVHKRVQLNVKNFFKLRLPETNAIVFFMMDGRRGRRMTDYIEKNVQPGTKVVSMVWPMPQWEDRLVKQDKVDGAVSLYLYQL